MATAAQEASETRVRQKESVELPLDLIFAHNLAVAVDGLRLGSPLFVMERRRRDHRAVLISGDAAAMTIFKSALKVHQDALMEGVTDAAAGTLLTDFFHQRYLRIGATSF